MTVRGVKKSATHMTVTRYLAISNTGVTRLTTGYPSLEPYEVAVKIDVTLPHTIFKKPSLEASITIPDEAGAPAKIEAVTNELMSEAVRQATGLDLSVKVVPHDDD